MDMEDFCDNHCPMSTKLVCRDNSLEIDCDLEESECPFKDVDMSKVILNPLNSLEPPEKVREDIQKGLCEFCGCCLDVCSRYPCTTVKQQIDSVLLKLQQAGWGDLKELVIENDRLEDFVVRSKDEYEKQEARIKELETEKEEAETNHALISQSTLQNADEQLAKAKAEARQQAFQEAKQWLDELFKKGVSSFKYTSYSEGTYYLTFPYDDFTAVQNKVKNELPKE